MSKLTQKKTLTIALVGNPNTGKSTLFNALSGLNQRVGNYPGVTVERRIGKAEFGDQKIKLIDLPGTYSLAPKSPDELVAFDVLTGRVPNEDRPDAILCVVDANNIERNLYLCTQLLELGLPLVIALNMTDVAQRHKIGISNERLEQRLGVPVVPIQANKKIGIDLLKQALVNQPQSPQHSFPQFEASVQTIVDRVKSALGSHVESGFDEFFARRLLLDNNNLTVESFASDELTGIVQEARVELKAAANQSLPAIESVARYQWIGEKLEGVVDRQESDGRRSWSDRIDKVLTHRVWGTLFFIALMVVVFQAIFAWSAPMMDLVDGAVGFLTEQVTALLPDGMVKSLVADGIMAGVGGVIIFLPQIFVLFFFIAILEDCGYMARAAYLMDKLMSRIGLSGKSFIPLLSSFACAIPGVMATRTIEDRRDRLVTMLVAPLMSCSARIPVYVLLIAAFIPPVTYFGGIVSLQGLTMLVMYLLGVVVAIAVAFVLRKTLLKGDTPPFVMELPDYKVPSLGNVFRRMLEQGWAFVRRAGTLIFLVSIVIWAMVYFPRNGELEEQVRGQYAAELSTLEQQVAGGSATESELEDFEAEIDNQVGSAYLQNSILGRMGKSIEPVVAPLGWDWKIAAATIASFPAREVIVGTLGVIYSVGDEADEESDSLRERLQTATWDGTDRKVYNIPVALSIMVFFALCAQCISTLAIMKRETASWRWPIFTFVYMTVLAYIGALITYQIGRLFL